MDGVGATSPGAPNQAARGRTTARPGQAPPTHRLWTRGELSILRKVQQDAQGQAVSRNYPVSRSLLTVICVSIALGGCATRQGWQLVEGQHPQKHEREITKTVRSSFLLFLPKGVADDPRRKWPLIVFMHGAGERGDDLEKLKVRGGSAS